MALQNEKQAGYFLWETMLLSIFLLTMTAAVNLYVQAAKLQAVEAVEGRADYLARAQISYAQALLSRDGKLPPQMYYLGDAEDLQQNDSRYQVVADAVEDSGLWQLAVTVSWEANGSYGKHEYRRCLVSYK